jgi:hypothetical protein
MKDHDGIHLVHAEDNQALILVPTLFDNPMTHWYIFPTRTLSISSHLQKSNIY